MCDLSEKCLSLVKEVYEEAKTHRELEFKAVDLINSYILSRKGEDLCLGDVYYDLTDFFSCIVRRHKIEFESELEVNNE